MFKTSNYWSFEPPRLDAARISLKVVFRGQYKFTVYNSLDVSMQDISQDEFIRAIKKLRNGKAAGVDEIQPELLKYGEAEVPYFTRLCNQIWRSHSHTVPAEWRNGIIIPLPRKAICQNTAIGVE